MSSDSLVHRSITRTECSGCGQEWHAMDCGGCGPQIERTYTLTSERCPCGWTFDEGETDCPACAIGVVIDPEAA